VASYTVHYNLAKPAVNDPVDEDLWGDELNNNMDLIDAAIFAATSATGTNVPTGSLFQYAGATAPSGYLLCYGQAISRSTYSALFAIVSTTYGTGDGSTTFNLPDCRGRVPAGKDDMGGTSANRLTGLSGGLNGDILGATGGSQSHTLVTGELASHTHSLATGSGSGTASLNVNTQVSTAVSPNANTLTGVDSVSGRVALGRGYPTGTGNFTTTVTPTISSITLSGTSGTAGSGDAHNNVQPTIIFNTIIKT
jgi:microcystin-dependent protein